ncbi:hypothetical protein M413DRAFT_27486 [Hebeloma cylindrosporum]|uniref:Uncharacterized protein n=1 Tax=Hebeloma cylindrosporum TaxID=76867 RepID=A0A0C3CE91_HEBCY|nr:hypothetical protein M413DRAFT_27486 [Hebeloma cylindrosporum h7]
MSSGPSNRALGADDGAPPPYLPPAHSQVNKDSPYSMPTPATDSTNQQASAMGDTGYQPTSPGMPVPQTTTTNTGSASSSGYSAGKYGTSSRSQPVPAAASPIYTTQYYYQPPPSSVYIPTVIGDPTAQGYVSEFGLRARKTSAYDEVRPLWDTGSDFLIPFWSDLSMTRTFIVHAAVRGWSDIF